jgi:hypothetical protein
MWGVGENYVEEMRLDEEKENKNRGEERDCWSCDLKR